MLTPFDIRDKIQIINNSTGTGDFGRRLRNAQINDLYLEVLEEIARGSPDAKTLAKSALEVKPRVSST